MRHPYLWSAIILSSAVLISLGMVGDGPLWAQNVDFTSDSISYFFRLKLEGTAVADYAECSGLGSSNDIVENVTVGDLGVAVTAKTPGELRWHDITLRRIGPSDEAVWSWRKALEDGDAGEAFRDGGIQMLATDPAQWKGEKGIAEWTFIHGWAASLTLDDSVEQLTIVHDGLQRVSTTRPTRPTALRP